MQGAESLITALEVSITDAVHVNDARLYLSSACSRSRATKAEIHESTNDLIQAGIDLYVVKELLGHKSLKMTMRYAHHYPESLRHGVDVLDNLKQHNASICYNSATVAKKEEPPCRAIPQKSLK